MFFGRILTLIHEGFTGLGLKGTKVKKAPGKKLSISASEQHQAKQHQAKQHQAKKHQAKQHQAMQHQAKQHRTNHKQH